ncbi:hypothetical protein V2O64_11395 [Verrucomicrobiaceae bacterium 227]
MSDPRGAVAAIGGLDLAMLGIEGPPLSADLASGWAKNDPDAALAWVRDIQGDDERSRALRAIAKRLIDVDGERAAAIFKEAAQLGEATFNNGGDLQVVAYDWSSAVIFLGNKDPAAAMAWVAKHYPGSSAQMISRFLPRDGVAAVESLVALPDSALKNGKLLDWPSEDWRPDDLAAAMERLSSIPESSKRESIHSWMLSAMAQSDPVAAVNWAARDLSDGESRAHIFKNGVENWARQDLASAGEWLITRESGVETDAAIGGFLMVAKYVEPEAAFEWAAVVSDPEMRMKQLESVYSTLLRTSGEEEARATLAKAPLSEVEVETIMGSGTRSKK